MQSTKWALAAHIRARDVWPVWRKSVEFINMSRTDEARVLEHVDADSCDVILLPGERFEELDLNGEIEIKHPLCRVRLGGVEDLLKPFAPIGRA